MQDEHFYDLMVGYFSDNLSTEEVAELLLWRDANEVQTASHYLDVHSQYGAAG